MADQAAETFNAAPLGVGAIISESFSILFKHFITVMTLAVIPALIGLVASGLLNGWSYALGMPDPNFTGLPNWPAIVLDILIQMVVYGLATALLVQVAYDSKLGRQMSISKYISPAIGAALPIAVLGLVAGILAGIGFMLLVIPGMWIYAVYSMIAPAVVIEGAGYRAMGRSVELTRGYRWPIFGALLIMIICSALIGGGVGFVIGMLGSAVGGGLLVSLALMSIATAVGMGLSGITISLIYARLREIKEGVSVDQIASVFD
jgi:hypothetical protein